MPRAIMPPAPGVCKPGYQLSPNGRASTSKDQAEGRCSTMRKALSATSSGFMKNESGLSFMYVRAFGGKAGLGNVCSNGGGLSSIGVSYTVINSLFSFNKAIGHGANPAKDGKPGGGSGGAIYNDGNTYTLSLCGVKMTDNHANEGGGAIFYVSNDLSGELVSNPQVTNSTIQAVSCRAAVPRRTGKNPLCGTFAPVRGLYPV